MNVESPPSQKDSGKSLIFRLSSLGDVVMALAALEVPGGPVDWVVAEEWAEILQGHPRIHRVWTFKRAEGARSWIALCHTLWEQGYTEVLDLHRSLRTAFAYLLFRWWDLASSKKRARWRRVSKQRWRLWGYHIFKRLWPKAFRPENKVVLAAKLAGGTGRERPSLGYILRRPRSAAISQNLGTYLCVMPASRWPGKEWPAHAFTELLRGVRAIPVVLGMPNDSNSLELSKLLEAAGVKTRSMVGKLSLVDVCHLLAGSEGYLGSDTGIAHLAQALGKPAAILFGPTAPDGGFGPWAPTAMAVDRSLWCRPCSKDGQSCFRLKNKFACLTELSPEQVRTKAGWIR